MLVYFAGMRRVSRPMAASVVGGMGSLVVPTLPPAGRRFWPLTSRNAEGTADFHQLSAGHHDFQFLAPGEYQGQLSTAAAVLLTTRAASPPVISCRMPATLAASAGRTCRSQIRSRLT